MPSTEVVVDACAMLNLLASGREQSIVRALDWILLQPDEVEGQMIYLYSLPDDEGNRIREEVSANTLINDKRLSIVHLEGDSEVDAFVEAAAQIDDADAACIALAGVRKLPLITDDRKERRIAQAMFPQIDLLSTLDVVFSASETLGWGEREERAVAYSLRWRGNFAPPRGDKYSERYTTLLNLTTAQEWTPGE